MLKVEAQYQIIIHLYLYTKHNYIGEGVYNHSICKEDDNKYWKETSGRKERERERERERENERDVKKDDKVYI